MGKGTRNTPRIISNNSKIDDKLSQENKENYKRITLFFDRLTNLNNLPYEHSTWITDLKLKGQSGHYFIYLNSKGDVVSGQSKKEPIPSRQVVDWNQIEEDIQLHLSVLLDEGVAVQKLQGKILAEINYERERQGMTNTRRQKGLPVNVKPTIQRLLERNTQPLFTGKWKKEAYTLRQYEPILDYVPTNSIDKSEGDSLLDSLVTDLDGYIGPAYNYDDQRLSEDWMLHFQDSMVTRLSESDFVRIQLENLMELMVNKVQDQVCNDLKALSREPLGLGSSLIEKPVWGIDSHTVKTIQLILEDYYWRNITPFSSPPLQPPNPDHFTLDEFKRFLARTLLPTINSVPTPQAHSMRCVLETIQNSHCPQLHKEYATIILSTFTEIDPNIYFRIHPKGTGVICIDPNGIPPHTVIADYLGELYPPYRWCEKLDVIQQAQTNYELKPTLPDFYNILLERPRKDKRGYGLIYVDASQRANLGSSCSHSCDANCTSAIVAKNGKLFIVLTTNRYVYPGEELCMDYYSITSSEIEWRSSICFCGSLMCRGTFLHYATQDELQQILSRSCGPAWRIATLLRGCSENNVTDHDLAILRHHGIGDIALPHTSPSWLIRYAIDTIKFLEYERKALPCALMRSRPMDSSIDTKDNLIQSQYTFVTADGDARSVLEQRMQSLLCSLSLITKFLSRQECQEHKTQFPLKILSLHETIARIWNIMKTIPSLIKKHLIQHTSKQINMEINENGEEISDQISQKKTKISQHREKLEGIQLAYKKLIQILPSNNDEMIPTSMSSLRQIIREIRQIILSIQQYSAPLARLTLLGDVLAMWCHTTNFVEIQEYQSVISEPIDVVARELGTTTITREKLLKYLGTNSNILQKVEINKYEDNKSESDNISETDHSETIMEMSTIETIKNIPKDEKNQIEQEEINEMEPADENPTSHRGGAGGAGGSGGLSGSVSGGGVSTLPGVSTNTGGRKNKRTPVVSLNPNDVIFSGTRKYSSTYIFWQLIGWFNAGTEQENDQPDLLGTSYLPLPSACFGYSRKDYTNTTREIFLNHWNTDKTLSLPFPLQLRQCFHDTLINNFTMLGSPVLDVGLGQVDAVENCLKEIFGTNLKKKIEEFGQYDLNLPPERPNAWVQCDQCLKWRRVPFHVNVEELPDQWTCSDNTWDQEKANCSFPQDNFDAEKEATLLIDRTEIEPVKKGDWKDVYCLRNEVYYEAKAIKLRTVKKKDNEEIIEILFHFKGWKSTQDEWIELGSERIAPHHLFTDATSKTIRDQEKWQGLLPIPSSSSSSVAGAGAAVASSSSPSEVFTTTTGTAATTTESSPSAKKNNRGTKRKSNKDRIVSKKSKNSL